MDSKEFELVHKTGKENYYFEVKGESVTFSVFDPIGVKDKKELTIVEARKVYRKLLNEGAKSW